MRLEDDIKDFLRARGVELVGLAGPERFDGPPSTDLEYSMPGAKSLVSMALPMHVGAVYDFLAKRSPAPHNLDQFLKYQRILRLEEELAASSRSGATAPAPCPCPPTTAAPRTSSRSSPLSP